MHSKFYTVPGFFHVIPAFVQRFFVLGWVFGGVFLGGGHRLGIFLVGFVCFSVLFFFLNYTGLL